MSTILNKDKLLELYPEYDSVFGPYTRTDNRKHVILNNSKVPKGTKGKLRTISYPKALIESTIERKLLPNETIDHKDDDFTNDTITNLRILDRKEHCSNDAIKYQPTTLPCVQCGNPCDLSKEQIVNRIANAKIGKHGPFCSRSCSGKYGNMIQQNIITKVTPEPAVFIKSKNKQLN